MSCGEIVYDEVWPHGDKTLCDDCYWDIRLDGAEQAELRMLGYGKEEE